MVLEEKEREYQELSKMRALLIELDEHCDIYAKAKAVLDGFPKKNECRFLLDHDLLMIIAPEFIHEQVIFLDSCEYVLGWSNIPAPEPTIELAHLMVPCSTCRWPKTYNGCYVCGKRLCISCLHLNSFGLRLCKDHAT